MWYFLRVCLSPDCLTWISFPKRAERGRFLSGFLLEPYFHLWHLGLKLCSVCFYDVLWYKIPHWLYLHNLPSGMDMGSKWSYSQINGDSRRDKNNKWSLPRNLIKKHRHSLSPPKWNFLCAAVCMLTNCVIQHHEPTAPTVLTNQILATGDHQHVHQPRRTQIIMITRCNTEKS